jgi:hypothetical protein
MIKNKKILFIILFPLLFASCGYEPMFKNVDNLDFIITVKNFSGDEDINKSIKSNLTRYSINQDSIKNYNINFNSNYKKITISKDTKGNATGYEIQINVKFTISSGEFEKEFNYSESFNMESIADILEEQDYEKSIKNSLVNIIVKKLIIQLSQIQ